MDLAIWSGGVLDYDPHRDTLQVEMIDARHHFDILHSIMLEYLWPMPQTATEQAVLYCDVLYVFRDRQIQDEKIHRDNLSFRIVDGALMVCYHTMSCTTTLWYHPLDDPAMWDRFDCDVMMAILLASSPDTKNQSS